jgi:hypothetical protein
MHTARKPRALLENIFESALLTPIAHNNAGVSFSFSQASMKSNCAANQLAGTACRPHS